MKIFRISNIMSFAIAILLGVMLFWTSQAVHQKEDILKDLQKNLSHEKEAIMVLGVEWDYLNRPQRLEKLASEQLGMKLPEAGGVAKSIEDIQEPVIVNIQPKIYQQAVIKLIQVSSQNVPIQKTKEQETLSPSMAEKQSFDTLIQSLDEQNGDVP